MDSDGRNVLKVLQAIRPLALELTARLAGNKTQYHVRGKVARLAQDEQIVQTVNRHEAWLAELIGEVKLKKARIEETKRRRRDKRQNQLSATEVDEEVHKLVIAEYQTGGLSQRKGERSKDWTRRVNALKCKVENLWITNANRLYANQPRYVDGLPARVMLRPPVFYPHISRTATGLRACLQCSMKKMRCSHSTVDLRQRPKDSRPKKEKNKTPRELLAEAKKKRTRERCQRCVRNGTPCMVLSDDQQVRAITKGLKGQGSEKEDVEMLERVLKGLEQTRDNTKLDIAGPRMEWMFLDNFALPLPWVSGQAKKSRNREKR